MHIHFAIRVDVNDSSTAGLLLLFVLQPSESFKYLFKCLTLRAKNKPTKSINQDFKIFVCNYCTVPSMDFQTRSTADFLTAG